MSLLRGITSRSEYRNLPFYIILLLSIDDAVHESGILKQCNGQLAIKTSIDSACEDLVNEVVDDTMQKVIPRKFKEQVL